MADNSGMARSIDQFSSPAGVPHSIDEARALARQRFKQRLDAGEKIGGCECHDESAGAVDLQAKDANATKVAGVRFIDSGQVYYFDPADMELDYGDWVVVDTSRGKEAARVVLAPHQVLASHLQGELKPIQRRLNDADVHRMEQLRRDSSTALKTFGAAVREHKLSMKPISAEYNFDGTQILFSYSAPERVDFRELARELGANLKCRVELRQVGARDEARLLGGLGRCGRTLCCSTWLPMFPEVSMGMAKTQDLALNPSKVSGVCGRLLCCLSYENEQYRQMKAVMPKLGQKATTPRGEGTVVSLQILKNLVTVQLETDNIEATFAATEISYGKSQPTRQEAKRISPESQVDNQATEVSNQSGEAESQTQPQRTGRRRRRRRGRGQSGQTS